MGKAHSYLNIWAVSTTVYASEQDLEAVLGAHEAAARNALQLVQQKALEEEQGQEGPGEGPGEGAREGAGEVAGGGAVGGAGEPPSYVIHEDAFRAILADQEFHPPDVDLLLNLFRLIDTRGFREIDIRDVLVSFAVLATRSMEACMECALRLAEREGNQIVDKPQLLRVFRLMNDALFYFGDKPLQAEQLTDLADSVYTSVGKIDGTIFYPHFVEFISTHPIVEMVVSPQFQGGIKDKLLDDEVIEKIVNQLR
ncbi:hypothetical protein B484DRAFT_14125 [Ochromonadaceae sp. CCMP2298]|nr:hypothetical protein B484DRAFT_14125 [Ochromonadaceae sp. CCMP2298]